MQTQGCIQCSPLTDERRAEIRLWILSLTEEQREMLTDIVTDLWLCSLNIVSTLCDEVES